MRRALLIGAALGLVAGLVGLLVSASGVIPIAASSGHWAVTAWFLDFSKRRSVATYALGTETLDFSSPWLVTQGAGHYEHGCRPCHGAPGIPPPRLATSMLPPPPALEGEIARWTPEELFRIIKHGIKFTAMPAWPSQARDDEVRAMVAFLLRLPELDAESYRRLVFGRAEARALVESAPPTIVTRCDWCHGPAGVGIGSPAAPKLAGQKREYLKRALEAYASGARHSGTMETIISGWGADDIATFASYYSEAAPEEPDRAGLTAEVIERGRKIAQEGIPARRVPSCEDCHGVDGRRKNAAYPSLAGQYPEYLVGQLTLFKAGLRGGSAYAHLMAPVVAGLSPEEMRDVAGYYAAQPPRDAGGEGP